MPITKDHISSPLEAGSSLLESQQLPLPLTNALEYVSSRLARKRLHLSLIVVRKEVQVPALSFLSSPSRTSSPSSSVTTSPAQSLFSGTSSTFSRSISKHSSQSSFSDSTSEYSATSSLSRTQWASLPSSPRDFAASPRIQSPSAASSPTLPSSFPSSPITPTTPTTPNQYGITLLHASTLTAKAEKILRHTIAKAEKKFSIGSGWLSPKPLTSTSRCPLTQDLIARSLAQNETIFSSNGLSLLSLDHIYTFKCHLHTYSRTLSPLDLITAIDELRRLVLAQNGKRITKSYLMRAYEWLGVSMSALVEVNEGYKTAYGGPERYGGIEVPTPTIPARPSPPALKTTFDPCELNKMKLSVSYSPVSNATTLVEKMESGSPIREVEVGESAKGKDSGAGFWGNEGLKEDRGPHRRGPLTPNGFEDITPVTKGEWCFLMVGEGWKARTAAVETC